MTYTSLATPVPNTPILVSTFGSLVKQDLDDLDGRVNTINATLGSWSGGTVASRINTLESGRSAKFSQTSGAQTLSGSNVKLQFNTSSNPNTAIVTAGGTNQDTFTAVQPGWYSVMASARCAAVGAALELAIYTPGNVAFDIANVKGTNGSPSRSCTVTARLFLSVGNTFAVNCFNNGTSGAVDTAWGTATNISIKYDGF
ncbi:MAG TPA: hypothetical protein VIM60_10380 [Edaphobacter sp.]